MFTLNKQTGICKKDYFKIFEALFENNLIPCAILDSEFNFIRVNKAYAQADNKEPADFIGSNHFELYPSDAEEIFRQVVATKQPYKVQAMPFVYAHDKGRGVSYWDWSIVPVLSEQNEVEFLVLTLHEVTKRVNAAKELDNFFNLSVDLLGMLDFKGNLIKINSYFAKILGYSKAELINQSLFSLIHEEDKAKMEQAFKNSTLTGQPIVNLENRCRQKDQTFKYIQWVIVPDKGQKICYVVGHDITESKKLQADLNRLETLGLLGTITAEINHELRNPMATIQGLVQLLMEKEECQKYKGYLELMKSEIDRAKSIVADYLSLAKVSNLKLKKRNLNEIVKKALQLIQANTLNFAVSFEIVLQQTPDILADENLLTQLVINLVQNGIDAMGRQGKITISTYYEEGKVILAVKDEGCGIAPDMIDKLDTPFFTTKENGVGLGLPICYRIAKNHNAEIEIKTGSLGTTFFVKFNQT